MPAVGRVPDAEYRRNGSLRHPPKGTWSKALARFPIHSPTTPLDVASFTAGLVGTVIRPEYETYDVARIPPRRPSGGFFLDALDDAAIDAILEHSAAPSSPLAMTQIRILGGAIARVPSGATAFAHRDAAVMVTIITPFEDAAQAPIHRAWTEAYPDLTYRRLANVKRRYDPTNLFHLNQNIRPTAEA